MKMIPGQPDLFGDISRVSDASQREVKCISLWQPWASLMACGAKFVETRDWPTHVRGPICIHAAQTFKGLIGWDKMEPRYLAAAEEALGLRWGELKARLPFGQIIAEGDLSESVRSETALQRYPDQEPFGYFGPGRFGHVYKNLTAIGPFPALGRQGFFTAVIPS